MTKSLVVRVLSREHPIRSRLTPASGWEPCSRATRLASFLIKGHEKFSTVEFTGGRWSWRVAPGFSQGSGEKTFPKCLSRGDFKHPQSRGLPKVRANFLRLGITNTESLSLEIPRCFMGKVFRRSLEEPGDGSRHDRGSILLSVVWMLTILVIFAVVIGRYASQELQFGRAIKQRTLERVMFRAGVERVFHEIQEDKFAAYDAMNETWASNELGFKEIKLGNTLFSIKCNYDIESDSESLWGACDESARLNINTAREHNLKNLFLAVQGGEQNEESDKLANQFSQSVIDWRDSDDSAQTSGAEATDYKALSEPYEPRNAPFESVEELLMVKGVTKELFDKIKPYVTVYTEGPVNFNTAPAKVLQALGLGVALADRVVEFRRGDDQIAGTEDDEVFTDPSNITPAISAAGSFSSEEFAQISNAISEGMVGVKSSFFRIYVYGRFNTDGQNYESQAACVMDRKGHIFYWKEGGNLR